MQRSVSRILTTHTGSLPRPRELTRLYALRARGQAADAAEIDRAGRAAVADVVRKQREVGIDVGNNGEQPRDSFFLYLKSRLSGAGLRRYAPSSGLRSASLAQTYLAKVADTSYTSSAMRNALFAFLLLQALAVTHAAAQSSVPLLRYTPPANAIRTGAGAPEAYSFSGFNASLQVYQFRPFTGDIRQAFQANLLRDWIDVQYREQNVGGTPQFMAPQIPGADFAVTVAFLETGYVRLRWRALIVSGNYAAIIDASAGTQQSFAALSQALDALGASLRIETARAPAALAAADGRAVAGLYQGTAMKVMVNTIGGGLYRQPALHFYLFSPDGRVYRRYDFPPVAAASIASFDFDAAEQSDRPNSGRYTIDGGRLIIRMGDAQPDIVTDPPRNGVLTINAVDYRRQ